MHTLARLLPCTHWPSDLWSRRNLRSDLEAGLVGAVLALPQAIALATLAGMPPEYGIYASIIPVVIAILWGSSWHTVAGPNTAVCMLLAVSVTPLALTASQEYIGLVLLLSLLVGLIQLLVGVLGVGVILDFISSTVLVAIVQAVALIMIVSASVSLLGVNIPAGLSFPETLSGLAQQINSVKPASAVIGLLTLSAGLLANRLWPRYAMLIAMLSGIIALLVLDYFDPTGAESVPVLGQLELSYLPFSLPPFASMSAGLVSELLGSALAISFLGLMQTVVIARTLAQKSGQKIDVQQDIIGQGVANSLAPFVSAFAGSGSFNRSAAHFQAGAKTPMALVYASGLLAVLAYAGGPVLAAIPLPAIAASLVLVAIGMFDRNAVKRALLVREEAAIFFCAFAAALIFGLNTGVLTGVLLSLLIYLWKTSRPNVNIHSYAARDGRQVNAVTIDGNLFFGSLSQLENALSGLDENEPGSRILLINTDHLTYLDMPGAEWLGHQVRRWHEAGSQAYLFVTRPDIDVMLQRSGLLEGYGDCIIFRDKQHAMKHILHPYAGSTTTMPSKTGINKGEVRAVKALAQQLRAMPFFGPIPINYLAALLEKSPLQSAAAGDIIIQPGDNMNQHLIVLEGELEAQRIWRIAEGHDRSHTWILKPDGDGSHSALLTAASNRLRVRVLADSQYLLIDADRIDELLGWSQLFDETAGDEFTEVMKLVRQVGIFHHLPPEQARQALSCMETVEYSAGDTVIREGDRGDRYFLVDKGEAEVIRTDPFTDETQVVDSIGAGDSFGEESLLQEGYRNATVRMLTPGRMRVLSGHDFELLVRPSMIEEISAEQAQQQIESDAVQLLDCRYDMEYEESRIHGAQLIPLHVLRFRVHELDPEACYIVYCRSGRRSKAAAFLLKERNFSVASLSGGIKDWPYEVDASVLT